MALSNQSELPGFFSPRHVNFKISHLILSSLTIQEDDFAEDGLIPEDDLIENGQILENYNTLESLKEFGETSSLKPSFGDKRISACRTPKFIGIF